MSITSLTLTNPGAEAGATTGWTVRAGSSSIFSAQASSPHSGTYRLRADYSSVNQSLRFDQEIDVSAYGVAIDANNAAINAGGWVRTDGHAATGAYVYVQFLNSSHTVLETWNEGEINSNSGWTAYPNYNKVLPANTRYVRIGGGGSLGSFATDNSYWDDFTLDISDDWRTDYPNLNPRVSQLGVYVLGQQPAASADVSQMGLVPVAAAETSNGTYDVYVQHLGIYALARGLPRRTLRAYTFTQDDHDFYGLNLGTDMTLIFDKYTGQWAQWRSPSYNYWRVADAVAWEGYNLGCDPLSGKIWKIDPEGRLDYDTTPITKQVVGMLTERFRKHVPCYMAELALSEGRPPDGVDAGDVGIQLRTSEDGQVWYDHGTVPSEAVGDDITVRWYGLGLMKSPGHVFEITDSGYARRIDGFNIEVPDGNQS